MRETFARVARNTDRVIERLRDIGYRFECEVGRYQEAVPPRSPASDVAELSALIEAQYGALASYSHLPGPFPIALLWFERIVGRVDLTQRETDHVWPEDVLAAMEDVATSAASSTGTAEHLSAGSLTGKTRVLLRA